MVMIFSLLGWVSITLGGLWSGATLFGPSQTRVTGMDVLARLFVAWPGLGLMFSGLLLLAIAGVLSRLDKIVRNTAGTAASTAALIDRGDARHEPRF